MSRTGRPTVYSDKLALEICERISNGESLKHVTEDDTMPARSSVHSWLMDGNHKDFLDKYETAKALQADVHVDEMDDIAHDQRLDTQRARLIIDTRKWTASKLKPKKYGDKLDLTTGGDKIANQYAGLTTDELRKLAGE